MCKPTIFALYFLYIASFLCPFFPAFFWINRILLYSVLAPLWLLNYTSLFHFVSGYSVVKICISNISSNTIAFHV